MKSDYSISVITPVYNEAQLLESGVDRIDRFLREVFRDYEIIIIESGSTDGSRAICDQIAKGNARIKVIHEGARNGFGSALKLGYAHADKDLIWLVTVDLPFPLESVNAALPLLAGYDCILSYRCQDNRDSGKKLRSWVFNQLTKCLLGLKVRHVNSAFKLFKKAVIKGMQIRSNGWLIDAEIIYRLQKKRIPFTEIPVVLIDRQGSSSSITFGDPVYVIKELLHFAAVKDQ